MCQVKSPALLKTSPSSVTLASGHLMPAVDRDTDSSLMMPGRRPHSTALPAHQRPAGPSSRRSRSAGPAPPLSNKAQPKASSQGGVAGRKVDPRFPAGPSVPGCGGKRRHLLPRGLQRVSPSELLVDHRVHSPARIFCTTVTPLVLFISSSQPRGLFKSCTKTETHAPAPACPPPTPECSLLLHEPAFQKVPPLATLSLTLTWAAERAPRCSASWQLLLPGRRQAFLPNGVPQLTSAPSLFWCPHPWETVGQEGSKMKRH